MPAIHRLTTLVALSTMIFGSSTHLPGLAHCAFAQGPLDLRGSPAQEALARLRGMWADARGLSLTLEGNGAEKGRLIADDEGRLLVDWTESVYEMSQPGGVYHVVGAKQYVVVSDGARMTEFDGRSRRTSTRPLDGRPRARSSRLAHLTLPFPGGGGYFAALLQQVDDSRARLEATVSGRSELVLPLKEAAQPSRILEYRVLFDRDFQRIEVVRVVGHDDRGPVGMRWTMHSIEALGELPVATMFHFELPEDAVEVAQNAFHMPLVGDVLPEFSVTTLADAEFSLDAALATNKAVLIQFWGSWCGPCIREFPHVEALAQEHRARGLAVLGLACDDTVDAARAAAERAGVTFPIAVDGDEDAGLWLRLGVRAFPTLMLVGPGRRVLWHSHARLGDVEGALESALPG